MIVQISKTNKIQLCSRCINHEINSWVNEKWKELNEEVKRQIYQELRSVKLKSGECIVCGNKLVSDRTPERILGILEENKTGDKVVGEFRNFFCQ